MNIKSIHKGDALIWSVLEPLDGRINHLIIVKEVHCDHIIATTMERDMTLWLDLDQINHEVYRRK